MIKKIELFGTTDVGQVRDHNEDNFAICKDLEKKEWAFKRDEVLDLSKRGALLVVADGMGGTNAGEVASHIAQETIKKLFDALERIPSTAAEREKILKKFIVEAHNDVVAHQHKNLETAGMGTTLVLAWVFDDSVHTAWSGDSRTYIYQGQNEMYPFTDDHSLVWQMVQEGQMSPEEARVHPESNIITQSLGDERQTPKPSAKSKKLYSGDKVMVCSDGLCGMLSDQEILNFMQLESRTAEICKEMVNAANRAGGTDNITVLMLEVKEADKRPASVSKEPIPKPKAPVAQPTTTQVLRKKNSNKNIVIGVLLLAIVSVLVWTFLPSKATLKEERLKAQMHEYESGKKIKINLAKVLLNNEEATFDSISVQYGKEMLKARSGILKFNADTVKPGSIMVKLYPKGEAKFYTSEIILKPLEKELESANESHEAAPALPNNPKSEQDSNNVNTDKEPTATPAKEGETEGGLKTEEPGDSNEKSPLGNEEVKPVEEAVEKPTELTPIKKTVEEKPAEDGGEKSSGEGVKKEIKKEEGTEKGGGSEKEGGLILTF